MILGTGHLCSVVGQQALVANSTPTGKYDAAFGDYTFAASLGQAMGPGFIVAFADDTPIPRTSAIFIGAALIQCRYSNSRGCPGSPRQVRTLTSYDSRPPLS